MENKQPKSKKIWARLALRTCGVLAIAAIITVAIMHRLPDTVPEEPVESADYVIRFPQDEQLMKELTAELMQDKEFSAVEPAAGVTAVPEEGQR